MTDGPGASKILETAILQTISGARCAHVEGEYVYVEDDTGQITRYHLSPLAKRIALLEDDGRHVDIQSAEVNLLTSAEDVPWRCNRTGR